MFTPFFAHCQELSIGAKAGLNISNIRGKDDTGTTYKTGFHLGATANYQLKDKLFLTPELMYSQQGFKTTYHNAGPSSPAVGETTATMNYLNFLPVSLKLYIGNPGIFHVLVGPQFGWLFSAREKGEIDGEPVDQDAQGAFNSFDFSAVVGIGADLESGLNFGGRLNYGFTDILDWDDDLRTIGSVKNIVFQVYVGYNFIKR